MAESTLYGKERKALIRWPHKLVAISNTGDYRLYDLDQDPRERRNLGRAQRETAELMHRELQALTAARPGSRRDGSEVVLDEETLEQLRALGYVD